MSETYYVKPRLTAKRLRGLVALVHEAKIGPYDPDDTPLDTIADMMAAADWVNQMRDYRDAAKDR